MNHTTTFPYANLMASLKTYSQTHQFHSKSFHKFDHNSQISHPNNVSFSGFLTNRLRVIKLSQLESSTINSSVVQDVPVLSCEEAIEKFRSSRRGQKSNEEFLAMYSSVFGGIITDPAAMLIPMDDHMVHRGHGVFDTALILDGHLYELDQHLNRFLRSAKMAKIKLPFDVDIMRSILIQTVSASKCKKGSLRYWLSAGPGDFKLSPSSYSQSSLYAIVIQAASSFSHKGVKVISSSIPIKPPMFATMKSVNYLPNVLCKMEAEEMGFFASIWMDDLGFVAEGPNMNVAFVTSEKELIMPRFNKILSGCTANRVLVLARELLMKGELRKVSVRDVTIDEGKQAEEMMLIGSGVLVTPVIQWDDQIIGNGKEGPIAGALLGLILEDMESGPSGVRVPVPY
ncbi:D-amino-acid transaminase, chloroplastic [Silene latifolia]|uniref:D-amino-acid transaminase, chloroplastic n=1 Tax=Silene latifolia TaxID=37657 RepID=UPI003D783EB7